MDNPWIHRRDLCIAHQGGELESPSNTLYAFRTAVAAGAHALELDLHATKDGHIVVSHDPDVDRCTDGSGFIDALTLAEVKSLDAAHRFVPGRDAVVDAADDDCPLRGVAGGLRPPPDGFQPNDFTLPTLREVLEAFPSTFLNMDIKRSSPVTAPYEDAVAGLLAEFGRTDDVLVASFSDETINRFRAIAPKVTTVAATDEAADLILARKPGPYAFCALQVPAVFGDRPLVTADLVQRAGEAGVAVHPWTINDRTLMTDLLDAGVHGIITSRPTTLLEVFAERRR